jgi:LysM repeat protein
MKKAIIFPFSISMLASLNANSSVETSIKHKTLEGESLSLIVRNYLERKENRVVRYKSRQFKETLKSFKLANPKIKNFNLIYPGQEITFPNNPKSNKNDSVVNYTVKGGDTVYTILKQTLKDDNPWRIVPVLKHLNPKLNDVDLIKVGDVLKLPNARYLASLKSPSNGRLPSSEDFKITGKNKRYTSNFLVEEEIYYLKGFVAQEFTDVFKSIVNANTKTDVIKGLKTALELSRDYNRVRLEESLLVLISSSFTSKKDNDDYLSDIRLFLETWKSVRSERQINLEGS